MTKSKKKKKSKNSNHPRLHHVDDSSGKISTNGCKLQEMTSREGDSSTSTSRFKNDFKNSETIGEGGFGIVFKVKHCLDNQDYAVKRIKLRAKDTKNILGEVKMLTKLKHLNVVRYSNSWIEDSTEDEGDDTSDVDEEQRERSSVVVIASDNEVASQYLEMVPKHLKLDNSLNESPFTTSRFLYIQMDYCGKDTLRSYIDDGRCQARKRRLDIFKQALNGLEYIHSKGILHRDLKPANIFIHPGRVKIGDFGLATRITMKRKRRHETESSSARTDKLTSNIGSLMYVSPEIMSEKSKITYGTKVDIYSLGIILFEMSYKPMTTGMERVEVLTRVRSEYIQFPDDYDESEMAREVQLIRTMLTHDPQQRPSAKALKQLVQKNPSVSQHGLEKYDLYCALMNSILNPQCLGNPEPVSFTEVEATFLKHCQGVSSVNTPSFKDACGISLEQFFKRRPDLYYLSTEEDEKIQMVALSTGRNPLVLQRQQRAKCAKRRVSDTNFGQMRT